MLIYLIAIRQEKQGYSHREILELDTNTCHILWKNELDIEKMFLLYFSNKESNSYRFDPGVEKGANWRHRCPQQ
jgi:hypothetical protein